jgi:group I intron endonuclease
MSNNYIRILSHPISYQELKLIDNDVLITGIYKIENTVNHKVYIGQSTNIIKRLKAHIKNEQNGHLRSSFEKYGLDNFSFEVIKQTYDLDYWEIFLIQIYHATNDKYGYNMAIGGEGGNLGPKVNKKISESLRKSEKYKQSLKSPERSAKLSYAAKHRSPETLYAIGSANRGKIISKEIRQKQSIAQKIL